MAPHQGNPSFVFEVDHFHWIQIMQQPIIVVESLTQGMERIAKSQMPFPDACRRVSIFTEQLPNSEFIRIQAPARVRALNPCFHPNASRVASRQQARSGWAANRRRRVVIREANAFLGHCIDPRRFNLRRSIAT